MSTNYYIRKKVTFKVIKNCINLLKRSSFEELVNYINNDLRYGQKIAFFSLGWKPILSWYKLEMGTSNMNFPIYKSWLKNKLYEKDCYIADEYDRKISYSNFINLINKTCLENKRDVINYCQPIGNRGATYYFFDNFGYIFELFQ